MLNPKYVEKIANMKFSGNRERGPSTVSLAREFLAHCERYPEARFMQALYSFLRFGKIHVSEKSDGPLEDCFSMENRAIVPDGK